MFILLLEIFFKIPYALISNRSKGVWQYSHYVHIFCEQKWHFQTVSVNISYSQKILQFIHPLTSSGNLATQGLAQIQLDVHKVNIFPQEPYF